jgi:hypothetical protein
LSDHSESPALGWHLRSLEYEGFPLYLRWPAGLNFDDLSARFSWLLVLTHTFSFRRFDGAPEPTYNDTLERFDLSVTRSFNSDVGQVVLVETFAGKRNYYFYVTPSVEGTAFCQTLNEEFAGYNLSVSTRQDPAWRFIRNYHAEYLVDA